MHPRPRTRIFSSFYRSLKNRVKKQHKKRRDARLCRLDIEKWKLEAPIANADFLEYKWRSTRPYSDCAPALEYDCSCHGTNKHTGQKATKMASASHMESNAGVSRCVVKDRQNQSVFPDAKVQIHVNPDSAPGARAQSQGVRKSLGGVCNNQDVPRSPDDSESRATVSSGNFSTKHSKYTRQYKYPARSPCQKHSDGEKCACRLSIEHSEKKELKQRTKIQKKWEKQKKQWQRQASYNQRGSNYQVLEDAASTELQNTPEMEQFERALANEHDKFQVRRSLIKKRSQKKEPTKNPPRRENKNEDEGHIHEHVDGAKCSCQAVVEYSRMMDRKYEEMKQEKLRKQEEQDKELQRLKNEQDKIEVSPSREQDAEKSTKKSKQKSRKVKEVQRSVSLLETSPTASPSRKLLTRSASEVASVHEQKPKVKLDEKPHTHDHESCSCRIIEEYSRQKEKEFEERRRKFNEKPVMDNDENAKKEQELKVKSKETKTSKVKKLIRRMSMDTQSKPSHSHQDHGSCSCDAVKEYTQQKDEEQQRKMFSRSKSESAASSENKGGTADRRKSSPGVIIDKTIASDTVDEPEFNIRIYKAYEKPGKKSEGEEDNDNPDEEVDPANVWLHPDDWTPVKVAAKDEVKAFDLVDWDQAVSASSTVPSSSKRNPKTLPYDPERWSALKTPPRNKAKSHVHTLNLSEWSATRNLDAPKGRKPGSQKENVDPSSVRLDPEEWTPVKEAYFPSTSKSKKPNLIQDPSEWTPVKRGTVGSQNGSEVPHKAADIYNQYAAQFQGNCTVSLPVDKWDPFKEELSNEYEQNVETMGRELDLGELPEENSTGHLPVEMWEPEKKTIPCASDPFDNQHLFTPFLTTPCHGLGPFGDEFNPAEPDQNLPSPFTDSFVPASSQTVGTTAVGYHVHTSLNPFTDSFVAVSSGDVASPNDSGCFSLASPLSDSGTSKQFVSSGGIQSDMSAHPLSQSPIAKHTQSSVQRPIQLSSKPFDQPSMKSQTQSSTQASALPLSHPSTHSPTQPHAQPSANHSMQLLTQLCTHKSNRSYDHSPTDIPTRSAIHTSTRPSTHTTTQSPTHTITQPVIHTTTQPSTHTPTPTTTRPSTYTTTQPSTYTTTQPSTHTPTPTTTQPSTYTTTRPSTYTTTQPSTHTTTQPSTHTTTQPSTHTTTQPSTYTNTQPAIHTLDQPTTLSSTHSSSQSFNQPTIHLPSSQPSYGLALSTEFYLERNENALNELATVRKENKDKKVNVQTKP